MALDVSTTESFSVYGAKKQENQILVLNLPVWAVLNIGTPPFTLISPFQDEVSVLIKNIVLFWHFIWIVLSCIFCSFEVIYTSLAFGSSGSKVSLESYTSPNLDDLTRSRI